MSRVPDFEFNSFRDVNGFDVHVESFIFITYIDESSFVLGFVVHNYTLTLRKRSGHFFSDVMDTFFFVEFTNVSILYFSVVD